MQRRVWSFSDSQMKRHYVCCICFIVVDLIVKADAQAPTWVTPSSTSLSLDGTNANAECNPVTELIANPGDATPVSYSLQSQSHAGVFTVELNGLSLNHELKCTGASITESSYSVVVRAIQSLGNGQFTDLTLTISVTGLTQATGPSCTQGTSLSLDTSDGSACTSVVSLTCTPTDGSSVSYSVSTQSPSAGFSVSSSILTCNQASITDTTYTVVVTAENTGNTATTDITFTITASSSSGSGSGGSGSSSSSSSSNRTGAIVGGVIGGVVVCVAIGVALYFIITVLCAPKTVAPYNTTKLQTSITEGSTGESLGNTTTDGADIPNGTV